MQDHDQYRLFLHLASTLSFTRTAADCHVSPATLSRTVQRLEAATGHRLLDRGPHGVALTEHGHRFRRYAADALELWARYSDNGFAGDQLSGQLRVFASVTACQSLLPDLLAPLRDAHPRVQISVRTGDAAAALALLDDGEADLAVAALPSRVPATLLARTVARTPLVLVRAAPPRSNAQLPASDEPSYSPDRAWFETSPTAGSATSASHPAQSQRPTDTKPCSPWSHSATVPASFLTSSCRTAASSTGSMPLRPHPSPATSPSARLSGAPISTGPWSPPPGQPQDPANLCQSTRRKCRPQPEGEQPRHS